MLRLLTAFLCLLFASETAYALGIPQNQVLDSVQDRVGVPTTANFCAPETCFAGEEHWLLMRSLAGTRPGRFCDGQRIKIYGWTEAAFTASSASQIQLPLGFNYRANEFLLQQNWLRIERTIDGDSPKPTVGFLSDTILPGSDYRFTVARGLADDQSGTYGFDPVQFYVQGYMPDFGQGLEIKAGRFFAQYGVESLAAISTPFVSRSYNFIYNPFTHTGLLTTLTMNDNWTVQNGIVTGSDVFFDSAAEPTYVGSVKWQAPESQSSLQLACIIGSGEFNQVESFNNPQVFDLVFTRQFDDRLSYKLDALYGFQTGVPGTGTANWYGIVNYLTYQCSQQLCHNARLEFFDDIDGNRTGSEGLYSALTLGLSYAPLSGLILRPEVRYDYNDQSLPFENRPGLFTAAFDLIVRW